MKTDQTAGKMLNQPAARAIYHGVLLARNYFRCTGSNLAGIQPPALEEDWGRWLFEAPFVLLSHGTEPDPVLNYGNRMALDLWEMDWAQFTAMPSRLTAETPEREERARLLESVSRQGYSSNYSGVRFARSGRRFRIVNASVWNVLDADGSPRGQAAFFEKWEWL